MYQSHKRTLSNLSHSVPFLLLRISAIKALLLIFHISWGEKVIVFLWNSEYYWDIQVFFIYIEIFFIFIIKDIERGKRYSVALIARHKSFTSFIDLYLLTTVRNSFFLKESIQVLGFPGGSDGKASVCNAGDTGLIPGSGRSPGEGNGSPLLPGKSHGQRSLIGYSPWGRKESDMTEWCHFHFLIQVRISLICLLVGFSYMHASEAVKMEKDKWHLVLVSTIQYYMFVIEVNLNSTECGKVLFTGI